MALRVTFCGPQSRRTLYQHRVSMADAAQAWRALREHFKKCDTCAQWDREWAGWQQFCPVGRQLYLSERLTDEDRERLEFRGRMSRFASSRDRFWKKAKAAAKATTEWVAGIGAVIGTLWAVNEILAHVHLRMDHDWWAYHVWKWYWSWWLITFPHAVVTVLAFYSAKGRDAP